MKPHEKERELYRLIYCDDEFYTMMRRIHWLWNNYSTIGNGKFENPWNKFNPGREKFKEVWDCTAIVSSWNPTTDPAHMLLVQLEEYSRPYYEGETV